MEMQLNSRFSFSTARALPLGLFYVTMLLNRLSFEAAYLITPLALFTVTGLLEDGPEIYNPICHNFDNHCITKKMQ